MTDHLPFLSTYSANGAFLGCYWVLPPGRQEIVCVVNRSCLVFEGFLTRRTCLTAWRWCASTPSAACRAWWSWSGAGGSTSSPPCGLATSLPSGPSTTTTASSSASTEPTCQSNSTERQEVPDRKQVFPPPGFNTLRHFYKTNCFVIFKERGGTSWGPDVSTHRVTAVVLTGRVCVWTHSLCTRVALRCC